MMGWYQGNWGFVGFLGMVAMLLAWGSLIWLAVWAIARFTRTESPQSTTLEPARAILDRRFAAGDLDAEEYASARRTLQMSMSLDAKPSPQ